MATKTLILRPISVTSDNSSLVTLYPSSTTIANAHILVNEEVADDDATYITGSAGSVINYNFSFTKPENFKAISECNVKIRYLTESGSSTVNFNLNLSGTSYTFHTSTSSITEYTDVSSSLPTNIIEILNSTISGLDMHISQTVNTGSKMKPVRVTQICIEVIYIDNENNTFVFYKQNDKWVKLNTTELYLKNNHKWYSLLDLSDIENNDKYFIKEVE